MRARALPARAARLLLLALLLAGTTPRPHDPIRPSLCVSQSVKPVLCVCAGCAGNPDAKRLYDDLLSNYNKLVRPVLNVSDALTVRIKLKLSQLIDVVSCLCIYHFFNFSHQHKHIPVNISILINKF